MCCACCAAIGFELVGRNTTTRMEQRTAKRFPIDWSHRIWNRKSLQKDKSYGLGYWRKYRLGNPGNWKCCKYYSNIRKGDLFLRLSKVITKWSFNKQLLPPTFTRKVDGSNSSRLSDKQGPILYYDLILTWEENINFCSSGKSLIGVSWRQTSWTAQQFK